jgi:hypothetical protein
LPPAEPVVSTRHPLGVRVFGPWLGASLLRPARLRRRDDGQRSTFVGPASSFGVHTDPAHPIIKPPAPNVGSWPSPNEFDPGNQDGSGGPREGFLIGGALGKHHLFEGEEA